MHFCGERLAVEPERGRPVAPLLTQGIAILDAPDVDSVVEENRDLAATLLAAADLWVFVTTAARYADAVPWALLRQAAERDVVIAVVLDRVPEGTGTDVENDLRRRLADAGLADAPVFSVPETRLDAEGFLPDGVVAPLRSWLTGLAEDAAALVGLLIAFLGIFLHQVTGSAVFDAVGSILGVTGRVLPMSPVALDIAAEVVGLEADPRVVRTIIGQVAVATTPGSVRRVRLIPDAPPAADGTAHGPRRPSPPCRPTPPATPRTRAARHVAVP